MAGRGLEHWAAYCGDGIAPEGVHALIADPRWPKVMRAGIATALKRHDCDRLGTQIFSDAGTVFAGFVALKLDAQGAFTHSAFRTAASAGGLMSPGRASAMLARMRATGFVAPAALTPAGRVRRYAATAAMVEEFRARAGMNLEALAVLDPRARRIMALLSEREALLDFCRRWGEVQARALVSADQVDVPFFRVIEHHLAVTLIFVLFESLDDGRNFPGVGATPLTAFTLASRLRTSTVQTRRLLSALAARNYVALYGRNIAVRPALVDDANSFFAKLVIGVAEMALGFLRDREPDGMAA